jgi:hypothetical protein
MCFFRIWSNAGDYDYDDDDGQHRPHGDAHLPVLPPRVNVIKTFFFATGDGDIQASLPGLPYLTHFAKHLRRTHKKLNLPDKN